MKIRMIQSELKYDLGIKKNFLELVKRLDTESADTLLAFVCIFSTENNMNVEKESDSLKLAFLSILTNLTIANIINVEVVGDLMTISVHNKIARIATELSQQRGLEVGKLKSGDHIEALAAALMKDDVSFWDQGEK